MKVTLSEKQIQLITEAAIKAYREESKRENENRYDRRLRNIKLLLRNYRSFVKHCDDIKVDLDILDEKLQLDFLDTDEFAIESIKRSKKRTLALVKYIQRMLAIYGETCEEEGPEALRRFDILKKVYIDEPKKSRDEIANILSLSVKTVNRDIGKSIEALSVLMFGVDGLSLK